MKRLACVLFAALTCHSIASASIIYSLTSSSSVVPGSVDYVYTATLSSDQKIDSTLNIGPAFGVIMDVPGIVSVNSLALVAGITVNTVTELLTNPQPVNTSVPDSGSVLNVRTNITGQFNSAVDVDIYTVTIRSTSVSTALGYQVGQALKDAPGNLSNNTLTGNNVRIEVPSGAVPEPATMGMFGLSLLGIGYFRKRRS